MKNRDLNSSQSSAFTIFNGMIVYCTGMKQQQHNYVYVFLVCFEVIVQLFGLFTLHGISIGAINQHHSAIVLNAVQQIQNGLKEMT